MSAQLEILVRHYKTALTEISKQAFSGSDESIAMLHQAIGDGKLIRARATGKLDLEDRMSKLFYAMLIPYLWRQKEWKPVLVDTKTSCSSKAKVELIADDAGKVCVDGKRYYLVRPNGALADCRGSASAAQWGMNSCRLAKVKSMDGFDKLKGGAWADLRKEDLAASIVARSKVGWKNPTDGGNWPAFDNSDHFDKMWDWMSEDNMIQVPGLIDIPMCGIDEVKRNWAMTKNNYYSWPCDRP